MKYSNFDLTSDLYHTIIVTCSQAYYLGFRDWLLVVR